MNKIAFRAGFVALLTIAMSAGSIAAQGIEFFHGEWSLALEKAKAENKLIFVDAFAEWCGPCKRMAANTFPDPKAGEFFNANFVNLKIDMEKPENAEFASKFPVSAYPTLMFINPDGSLALRQTGALGVDALLEFGRKALGSTDKSGEMETQYNDGNRDPEFLYKYVKALNKAGKPSLKITNEYLAKAGDLNTPFNLRFILEGAVEADSRVFDLLIKNRAAIAQLESEKAVNVRIEQACRNTVKKAIEFRDEKLLNEAKSKMKQHLPDRAEAFALEADQKYALAVKDPKGYLKTMKARQKELGDGAAQLHDLSIDLMRAFPNDPKVLKQAEKWAKAAAKKGGLPEYYLTLAEIYKRQGDNAKARRAAQDARKAISQPDAKNIGAKIDYFLESLE